MNYREPESLNRFTILGAQLGSAGLMAGSALVIASGALGIPFSMAIPAGIFGAVQFLSANKAAHVHAIHATEEKELRQHEKDGVHPPTHFSDHLNQNQQVHPIITKTARISAMSIAAFGIGALTLATAPALFSALFTGAAASINSGLLVAGAAAAPTGLLFMKTSEVADHARGYAYSDAAQRERDMTTRKLHYEKAKTTAPAQIIHPEQEQEQNALLDTEPNTYWRDILAAQQAGQDASRFL